MLNRNTIIEKRGRPSERAGENQLQHPSPKDFQSDIHERTARRLRGKLMKRPYARTEGRNVTLLRSQKTVMVLEGKASLTILPLAPSSQN